MVSKFYGMPCCPARFANRVRGACFFGCARLPRPGEAGRYLPGSSAGIIESDCCSIKTEGEQEDERNLEI